MQLLFTAKRWHIKIQRNIQKTTAKEYSNNTDGVFSIYLHNRKWTK